MVLDGNMWLKNLFFSVIFPSFYTGSVWWSKIDDHECDYTLYAYFKSQVILSYIFIVICIVLGIIAWACDCDDCDDCDCFDCECCDDY